MPPVRWCTTSAYEMSPAPAVVVKNLFSSVACWHPEVEGTMGWHTATRKGEWDIPVESPDDVEN